MRRILLRLLAIVGLIVSGLGPVVGGLSAASEVVLELNLGPCQAVELELALSGLGEGGSAPPAAIEVNGTWKELAGQVVEGTAFYRFALEDPDGLRLSQARAEVPDGWSGTFTVVRQECVQNDAEQKEQNEAEQEGVGSEGMGTGTPAGGEGEGGSTGGAPTDKGTGGGDGASEGSAADGGPFGPPPGPLNNDPPPPDPQNQREPVRFTVWKHFSDLLRAPSGQVTVTITNQTTGDAVTVTCTASSANQWFICGISDPLSVQPGDVLEVTETPPADWEPYVGPGTYTMTMNGPTPNPALPFPNSTSANVWQCTRPRETCGISLVNVHVSPLVRVSKEWDWEAPSGSQATIEVTINGIPAQAISCTAHNTCWQDYPVESNASINIDETQLPPGNWAVSGEGTFTLPSLPAWIGSPYCVGRSCKFRVYNDYSSDGTRFDLFLYKTWEDPMGLLPNRTATYQIVVRDPDNNIVLNTTCSFNTGNQVFPSIRTDRCWRFLIPAPPAGSTVEITEIPPPGVTPNWTTLTFTIPPDGGSASGPEWDCTNGIVDGRGQITCQVRSHNRFADDPERRYQVEFALYKVWNDTSVWPTSVSEVEIRFDNQVAQFTCPPAQQNGPGLQTPIPCTVQSGSPLTGVAPQDTLSIDEPVVPYPYRPWNVPTTSALQDLSCRWVDEASWRIRCNFPSPYGIVDNRAFDGFPGFLEIYKQWIAVPDPNSSATIEVTIGNTTHTLTCPYAANGAAFCGRVPIPEGTPLPTNYTVQETQLPSDVAVFSGTGQFQFPGSEQQCRRDAWDRPYCRHDVINRTTRRQLFINKQWDPDPPEAGQVVVTVAATGPNGAQFSEDVTCTITNGATTCTPYPLWLPSWVTTFSVTESGLDFYESTTGTGTHEWGHTNANGLVCNEDPYGISRCVLSLINRPRELQIVKSWYPVLPENNSQVILTIEATGPDNQSFTTNVTCVYSEPNGTVCTPSSLFLPVWATAFTITESNQPPGYYPALGTGQHTWNSSDGNGLWCWTHWSGRTICTLTVVNRLEGLPLFVGKRWIPTPPPGARIRLHITASGPNGESFDEYVTCTVNSGCQPLPLMLPEWVTTFTVEELDIPSGYYPLESNPGQYTWDSSTRNFQCEDDRSGGITCYLNLTNGYKPLYLRKTWYPQPPPPGTVFGFFVTAEGPDGTFEALVSCEVQQHGSTQCNPDPLHLPLWVGWFTVREVGLPNDYEPIGIGEYYYGQSNEKMGFICSGDGGKVQGKEHCVLTVTNQQRERTEKPRLYVSKSWVPQPPAPGTVFTLLVSWEDRGGQTGVEVVRCEVLPNGWTDCSPNPLILPEKTERIEVTEDYLPEGYEPIQGTGPHTWGSHDDQGFQCQEEAACSLQVVNRGPQPVLLQIQKVWLAEPNGAQAEITVLYGDAREIRTCSGPTVRDHDAGWWLQDCGTLEVPLAALQDKVTLQEQVTPGWQPVTPILDQDGRVIGWIPHDGQIVIRNGTLDPETHGSCDAGGCQVYFVNQRLGGPPPGGDNPPAGGGDDNPPAGGGGNPPGGGSSGGGGSAGGGNPPAGGGGNPPAGSSGTGGAPSFTPMSPSWPPVLPQNSQETQTRSADDPRESQTRSVDETTDLSTQTQSQTIQLLPRTGGTRSAVPWWLFSLTGLAVSGLATGLLRAEERRHRRAA